MPGDFFQRNNNKSHNLSKFLLHRKWACEGQAGEGGIFARELCVLLEHHLKGSGQEVPLVPSPPSCASPFSPRAIYSCSPWSLQTEHLES